MTTLLSPVIGRAGQILRPWLVLLVVCAAFSLHPAFARTFWHADFLRTIMQQAATTITLAVGMTFVIVSGGIDLSVGSVMALCGVTLGMATHQTPPAFMVWIAAIPGAVVAAHLVRARSRASGTRAMLERVIATAAALAAGVAGIGAVVAGGIRLEGAIVLCIAVGAGCGLLNGLAWTRGGVPPFVATLGMFTAARGLTIYATNGNSIGDLPARLAAIGAEWPPVLIALAAVGLGAVTLARTPYGRRLIATGGNEEAARLSGIEVRSTRTAACCVCGISAAIASVLLTAKFAVADTGAGMGAELNAIAAVVIGGTSLSGGEGTVLGSLVGALTIVVLNAGLVLVGAPQTLQGVIVGGVIVATVMIDRMRRGTRSPAAV